MDTRAPPRKALIEAVMLNKKKMPILEVDMIGLDHQLTTQFVKNNTCQDLLSKMQELKWHMTESWPMN